MVHKYISSKVIIDRLYNNYNIQSDDFVTKLSTWVYNCIRDLQIKQIYIMETYKIPYNNYRIAIPQVVDKVYGVIINGKEATVDFGDKQRIDETLVSGNTHIVMGFDGVVFPNDINIIDFGTAEEVPDALPDTIDYYDLNNSIVMSSKLMDLLYWKSRPKDYTYKINNGWVHVNLEAGICELLVGSIPYEYDETLDILFPIIPDDELLIKSITYHCLENILMRGYKHPILALTNNNEFTNPSIMYVKSKVAARNSCNSLSPSAKRSLSILIGSKVI